MAETFQQRVDVWLLACFGETIARDRIERNHRFLEEALETVQSNGCARSEAHQLVDYVYDRPAGELAQEIGGAVVTLAALCLASGIDMAAAGETELARIWTKVEKIRAKQAAKPKHSPLPEAVEDAQSATIALLERRVKTLEAALNSRDKQAKASREFWVRAAKSALNGDARELRNRVALAEASPAKLIQSEGAQ